jgi:PAS domain S-box-containing protein
LLTLDQRLAHNAALIILIAFIGALGILASLTPLILRRRDRKHLSDSRRTEALLRTIQEATPSLIYAKDLLGRMLIANPPTLAFIGKSWAEVEGRTDREFLDDPAQGYEIMVNDRRIMDRGRTEAVEERVGEGEGVRIFLSTKTPMCDASGVIIGMVGVSVDITDRKRSEERVRAFTMELERGVSERTTQLAASEARQRAYFNNSPIGMVVMHVRGDGQFVLEDMNAAARLAFGFSPDSARGRTQSELWPELIARDKQQKMQSCASSRQVIEYSVKRDVDGKARLLDIVLAPLMDDSPDVQFVLMCVHDVTGQRELERQIVEQAERRTEAAERERAIFHNSSDLLFIVGVQTEFASIRFIYEALSPSLELLYGRRAQDLIGRDPETCFPPAEGERVGKRYRRCVEERMKITYAETRDTPAGKRDYEGSLTPIIHQSTGRVVRLVGAVRDVTERNGLEAALRHNHKMQAIGQLAAGVAHDFNNILQAVIGGLDLVMDETEAGTAAHDFAGIALRSATRGSHITHHLLSYARKQMLSPQDIELATFLPDIATLLTRTIDPHVTIELRVQHNPRVFADPGELQTALLNLAINAGQAMPEGGTLQIEAQEESTSERPWTRITVTDTGVGMDDLTVAQASEPFFTTKGVEGTGLGLSMVHGFVEQSGGTLRIASTPGRGTSVELRLPAPVNARQKTLPEPVNEALYSGRILLVDDATDVLVVVGAFLEKAGFNVVRADCGAQALAFLAQGERFNALVTDYAMPDFNGGDLILQARILQPGLSTLIITGYASVDDDDTATEGVAILHKPFRREELIETLLRVMGRGPASDENTHHAVLA